MVRTVLGWLIWLIAVATLAVLLTAVEQGPRKFAEPIEPKSTFQVLPYYLD